MPLSRRLLAYTLVALIGCVIPCIGYRLDRATLQAPLLYDEDALLILPMVKSCIETGTHWRTDRLGAPGIQEMHDFPVVDHLHFAAIWILGQFISNAVVVFNLYFLLTYPLAAVIGCAVLRHFQLSFAAAAVGGLLYCAMPYHQYRGESHYFLSAYYCVPLTLMTVLHIARNQLPFFPDGPCLQVWHADTVRAVVIGTITASAGAYYAFFGCILLLAAGLYGWLQHRRPAALAAALLTIGVIFVMGLVHHVPTYIYHAKYGKHTATTARFSEESELYPLKLTELLFPIDDHRILKFAQVKARYNTPLRPAQTRSERHSLGMIASIGFVILIVRLVLPLRRETPTADLSAIVGIAFLVGTMGGLGAIFNLLISPQVRCYNRMVVYIAFLCLFAVMYWLDELLRQRAWVWPIVLLVGLFDQTAMPFGDETMAERNEAQQQRFLEDAAFFRAVEVHFNPQRRTPGPMVFQLPYLKWPEAAPMYGLPPYDHARGFLHTHMLRWSFGAMNGRESDEWIRRTMALPAEDMVDAVVAKGFTALLVDKRGYAPGVGDDVICELLDLLGDAPWIEHDDGQQVVLDLRPYAARFRKTYPNVWAELVAAERDRVQVLWLDGIVSTRGPGDEWREHWCRQRGLMMFVNPTDTVREVTVQCAFRTFQEDGADVQIRSSIWNADLWATPTTPEMIWTLKVPPGRHAVHLRCELRGQYLPSESRQLRVSIVDFELE